MVEPHRQGPALSSYVRKIRVPVRLAQPNQPPRDGWFLLFPSIESGRRPETLLELMNSPRTVIPFIQADDENVLFLTRINVDWVVVGKGVETGLVFPPGYAVTSEQRVDLRLVDESHVHAVIRWNSRDQTVRLSDFLNSGEPFFPAVTSFGTLLVNKLRVRETRLEESTDRPVSD